jgi:hypothetical protein
MSGGMTIEKAILTAQQCAFTALADMNRLWSSLSKSQGKRADTVRLFLNILNRAKPDAAHDPSEVVSNCADGIFGLPLVFDAGFIDKANELLGKYPAGGDHSPPLWLRLIPGWWAIVESLGLRQHLIAVSVAVNNGDGGPASSSVVLNSHKNLPDLSSLPNASKVRTFVVTLQRPAAGNGNNITALPYIGHGIRFIRARGIGQATAAPYLKIVVNPDGADSKFGHLILPESAINAEAFQGAWVAAFARWLIDQENVSETVPILIGNITNGLLKQLPNEAEVNQIGDYVGFISNFCKDGKLPAVLDTMFCPAVLWSVDPAHQGSAANCYYIFDKELTADQAQILLHASQTLLAGVGQFSTGHFLDSARVEELERAEQMLLKLQRPLDELTDAFGRVQAEAQEMQAILNDPEEGVFKAHKALAPLFQQGHAIQISHCLFLSSNHEWSESEPLDNLQLAYCYALACIFGVQNRLQEASSREAFVEKARGALREKRESGVNGELIQLLTVLCGLKDLHNRMGSKVEIEDSVQACWRADKQEESVGDMQTRYSASLNMLKRVAFTPFKSFGQKWPIAPAQVAAVTKRLVDGSESLDKAVSPDLPPQDTPFSQHAILSFIIGVKSEIKSKEKTDHPVSALKVDAPGREPDKDKGGILTEYRLKLPRRFLGKVDEGNDPGFEKLPADLEILQDCIRSTIRHGIVGKVMGSFHGIFQDLLRHGLNLATADDYKKDAWVMLDPPKPTWDRAILLVLGKAKADRGQQGGLDKFCESHASVGRYFALVQEKISPDEQGVKYWLRIIWTDKKETVANSISGTTSGEAAPGEAQPSGGVPTNKASTQNEAAPASDGVQNASSTGDAQLAPSLTNPPADWPQIVCIDHNSKWCDALKQIPFLKDKVYQHPFDKPEQVFPVTPCVVVLHCDAPGQQQSAKSWEDTLRPLMDAGKVLHVVVASAGGHPREKGIAQDKGFLWAVHGEESIHDTDLAIKESAKRSRFLTLIRKGEQP